MQTRLLVSVIDDDESVRESLPDLLREFGFEASAFQSAEEFIGSDCISRTRCLILDSMMPDMNGYELVLLLKSRSIDIPVVFITANHSELNRAQMLDCGATAYLYKPFEEIELLDALMKALRKHWNANF